MCLLLKALTFGLGVVCDSAPCAALDTWPEPFCACHKPRSKQVLCWDTQRHRQQNVKTEQQIILSMPLFFLFHYSTMWMMYMQVSQMEVQEGLSRWTTTGEEGKVGVTVLSRRKLRGDHPSLPTRNDSCEQFVLITPARFSCY